MLSLSSRAHYAALAVTHLARTYGTSGLTKSADIARIEAIPQSYLEQLMSRLCKAQIITSHRGARGGYKLARDPNKISIRDVIEAVDGPVLLRPDEPSALQPAWRTLTSRVSDVLDLPIPEFMKLNV